MIEVTEHGEVHELRLNRPPANALSPELIAALRAALAAAPARGARGVVLSGAPGMFSAGLDVPHLLRLGRDEMALVWQDFYALMRDLAASPVPVVAAITGHSPAGGAVLALFCDGRVMAEGDWRIGLNEVQVGIILPPVILRALSRLVGARQAERLGVAGAMVPAAVAARVGLVDELAAADQVVPRAIERVRELLALPAAAMAATRRMARADLVQLFEADPSELQGVLESWFSPETQAALRALVERLAKKRAG